MITKLAEKLFREMRKDEEEVCDGTEDKAELRGEWIMECERDEAL